MAALMSAPSKVGVAAGMCLSSSDNKSVNLVVFTPSLAPQIVGGKCADANTISPSSPAHVKAHHLAPDLHLVTCMTARSLISRPVGRCPPSAAEKKAR